MSRERSQQTAKAWAAGCRSGAMKQPAITFALALLAGAACNPKDTEKPDGGGKGACTEEAKQCADGSSVVRGGPDCEFPACPGEGDAEPKPEPEGDSAAPEGEGGGEPEPAADGE